MNANSLKIILISAAGWLAGCGGADHRLDLNTYSPVIDYYQYDTAQFNTDITQCRQLAIAAQQAYDKQQAEEQADILASAVVGALVGAAVGNALDGNDDSGTTIGAIYGTSIGASSAAEANDYNRLITKFGPSAIIDNCMANRSYQILSKTGYGGG